MFIVIPTKKAHYLIIAVVFIDLAVSEYINSTYVYIF